MKTAKEYPYNDAKMYMQQTKPDRCHETSLDLDLYIDLCLMDIRMQPYGHAGEDGQGKPCENHDDCRKSGTGKQIR